MICKPVRMSLYKREKNLKISIKLNFDENQSFYQDTRI